MATPQHPSPDTTMANSAPPPMQPRPPEQAIAPWLQLLSQLMPPTGVLLVGAGNGAGPWVQLLQTLDVPSATLVEADDTQFEHLQRSVPQRPGWRLRKQVVGPRTETVTYYQASNAFESGLLAPESLRSLWPNLKTAHKQTRQAIALAELQQDADPAANWLLLDCLPALPILQGAAQQLAGVDVIAVRVLLNASAPEAEADSSAITTITTITTSAAAADQLQPALQALGFRCLAIETSRHPALGHALFVRDTAAKASQLQRQLSQQDQTHQEQTQALAHAKTTAEKLAAACQATLAALQTQHEQLAQEQTKLMAASAELTSARDQLGDQLAAESKTKAEALAQRDTESKAKAQAIAQRDALAKEQTALAAARDEQAKLAAERQTVLSTLQTQHDSLLQEKAKLIADNAELAKAKDQLGMQLAAETKATTEALAQRDVEAKAKTEVIAQRDAEAEAKAQAITQRDALIKDKAALTFARDEQAKLATERQAALSSLQTQHDSLVREKAKLISDSAELAKAKDQLGSQLAAEAKARAEALAQRDAEAKAKSDAITQRDAEAIAKAQAIAQRDQLANDKAALTAARDEQTKLAAERQAALSTLQTQHDSLVQEKAKLIANSAELAKAKDQLSTQLAAETKARTEALAQRDADAKAKAEAVAQRDAEAKAKSDAIAQRDQLAKEKAALTVARDEQAKLATDRQTALVTLQQESETKLQRFQRMEADNQEHAMRQQMMQDELIRAEAQIELIKDLLLREPGL